MNSGRRRCALMLCLVLLAPLAGIAQADGQPVAPSITTSWTENGNAGINHAYTLTFADDDAYEIEVNLTHMRNQAPLANEVFTTWSSVDGHRIADLVFNTSLQLSLIHI